MFGAVVFSKDRPLQLEGFLRSLFANCPNLAPSGVTALVAVSEGFSFAGVQAAWPGVNFVAETSFQADLRRIVENGPPYLLVGCDDVFFTRPFDPGAMAEALATDPELFGVSLRLGRNIRPLPLAFEDFGPFLRYHWKTCATPQWDYPFDVSATVYRREDFLAILDAFEGLRTPNFLEAEVATAIAEGRYPARPALACYPLSRSLTLTVNRVQETHQNPFDAREPSSPRELQQAFDQGGVLATEAFARAVNHVIHTDARYFRLRRAEDDPSRTPVPGLVSVICYTHNRLAYLPKMIASVLSQDYADIELLVYDDASDVDMRAVVAPFLADPRLRFVQGDVNIGGSGAFDKLCDLTVSMTRGEFICFAGDDDVFKPQKTSRQLAMFHERPELDVVFCDAHFIDAKGRMRPGEFRNPIAVGFTDTTLTRLQLHSNSFAHPCVMMRREALELVGGFDCGAAGFCADYHLWSKIAPFLNIAFLDEKLVAYRIHDRNESIARGGLCRQSTLDCKADLFKRFTIYDFFPELYACRQEPASLATAYLELGNLILGAPYSFPELAAHCYETALSHASSLPALANLLLALALAGRGAEVRLRVPALLADLECLPRPLAEQVRTLAGQALAASKGMLDSLQGVALMREAPDASLLRRMLG